MHTASGSPCPSPSAWAPCTAGTEGHAAPSRCSAACARSTSSGSSPWRSRSARSRSRGFTRNGVRVETLFTPVDEIGGDFLEAFFLDDHTLIATMADATGHGISASLFTMAYKTLLHSPSPCTRPGQVLEHVNSGFLESAGHRRVLHRRLPGELRHRSAPREATPRRAPARPSFSGGWAGIRACGSSWACSRRCWG